MTDDERAARLAAIAGRASTATPGPWRWKGNKDSNAIYLMRARAWGDVVMAFFRWGMQSAQPRFCTDGLIVKPKWAMGPPHHPWEIVGIDHPDARFIEHSREDIDWLLGEVERLRALAHDLADKEQGARVEQMRALHAAGIIATDESLHAHIERADAFTARQHNRIDCGEEIADGG